MHEQNDNLAYEFAGFTVDVIRRRLLSSGTALPLTPKSFDTLLMLVRRQGKTVSKTELMDSVWAETAVEENNLTQQISILRRILGERPNDHRFIVTVPGKGYSFVADVRTVAADRLSGVEAVRITPTLGLSESVRSTSIKSTLIGYSLAFSYILLVVIVCIGSALRYQGDSHRQSLAVLEFSSAGTGDEFIGAGISDTLRARLGSVQDLIVLRDNMTHGDRDVIAAGRRLKVDTVITGSVQRDHERIRVAVELLNTADGRIVWSKTYDASASNIFALQDSIAGEIARALNVRIASASIAPNSSAVNSLIL